MNARRALVVVVVALVAIFAWLLWPRPDAGIQAITLSRPRADRPPLSTARPVAAADQAPPEPRSELADRLNAPTGNIRSDLRIVENLIDAYRSNFRENPVVTNAEITAALSGKNRLHLALLPRDHPAINVKGELCDRWGRPFFFHQLSGTQMEIRSSGPDRTMWTDDDAVLDP